MHRAVAKALWRVGDKGTRIPVELIVRKIASGETESDLLRGYPRLTPEAIQAALMFAAEAVKSNFPDPKKVRKRD